MYIRMHREGRYYVASINLEQLREAECRRRIRVLCGQESEPRVDTRPTPPTAGEKETT